MSRTKFLFLGLVIISFTPMAMAVIAYLGIAKIIDSSAMNQAGVFAALAYIIGLPVAFGTLLHLRFKNIGRRKRILVLCLALYIISLPFTICLSTLYSLQSDAMESFMGAIGEWAKMSDLKPESPWSRKHAIDYALSILISHYLGQLGLFALLWFGSLDPRKPNTSQFSRFISRAVTKTTVRIQTSMQQTT